jgi:hypothetical protein
MIDYVYRVDQTALPAHKMGLRADKIALVEELLHTKINSIVNFYSMKGKAVI